MSPNFGYGGNYRCQNFPRANCARRTFYCFYPGKLSRLAMVVDNQIKYAFKNCFFFDHVYINNCFFLFRQSEGGTFFFLSNIEVFLCQGWFYIFGWPTVGKLIHLQNITCQVKRVQSVISTLLSIRKDILQNISR